MSSQDSLPSLRPAGSPGIVADALAYWERRRLVYNLLLFGVVITWVVATWPHFRPAFTWSSLFVFVVLALLANVCYCAVYLADIPMQNSSLRESWRRWRWSLWLFGTLLAILFANYWIADEIYSYVLSVR